MSEHYPVLVVVLPLLTAPIITILASARLGWWLAVLASWAALGMALHMLVSVSDGPAISYALGNWVAPLGIEYRVDSLTALVLVLVSGISAIVLPFARHSTVLEVAADRLYLFYTCWLLCLSGLLGITVTGDAFNVFVFLEISSLSTYVLVSLAQRREAQLAAFRYLIMGTVGATFILIGIGLLYMMTGTLNMADLAERLPGVAHTRPVRAGVGFILVGVAVKMALFPLHSWLPGAYYNAPTSVTAFLAGTATKVAVYLLLRFALTVFGAAFSYDVLHIGLPLVVMGVLAAFVGSAAAMMADDVKRLLAVSSLAQIGYMVIGFAAGNEAGVAAAMLHVFNHAIIKTALFMAVGCVAWQIGSQSAQAFRGLGRRMPLVMAAFTVAAASLVGVPLTAGFISKWYVVLGALQAGWWPVAAAVIVTSLMALVYMGRLLEAIWLGQPPAETDAQGGAVMRPLPLGMVASTVVLAAANLYFGIDTDMTVDVAVRAAALLLGGELP